MEKKHIKKRKYFKFIEILKIILLIFMIFISNVTYGQISERDSDKADLLKDNFQSHIDSINFLTNGAKIYYISDTLFKGIILALENRSIIELDLRYKNDFRGYTILKADFENYVLLEHRGDGSGNPTQLRVINKKTGEDYWIGEYLLYIDEINEVVIYTTYTDSFIQIVIHNFLTNKLETYPTKEIKYLSYDFLEVIQLNNNNLTIKFIDLNGNMKELKIKRIN